MTQLFHRISARKEMNLFTKSAFSVLALSFMLVMGADAQVWDEITDGGGDAGDAIGTAQNITLSGAVTTINGSVSVDDDVDIYCFTIITGSAFSASTVGNPSGLDPQMGLYDASGFAIYFNDDDAGAGTFKSLLPAGHAFSPTANNATHCLSIAGYNNYPQNGAGNQLFTYDGTAPWDEIEGPDAGNPGPLGMFNIPDGETNSGAYSITLTSVEGSGGLPVELTSFTATTSGQQVALRWATASETNNHGFDVEMRRSDNVYETLGFVAGSGTSSEANSYAFQTDQMDPGVYNFRLRQINIDGNFEYSNELEVEIDLISEFAVTAPYPNPAADRSSFDIAVREQQFVRATLYNLLGQEVSVLFSGNMDENGVKEVSFDTAELSAGTYIVRVEGDTFRTVRNVSVIR